MERLRHTPYKARTRAAAGVAVLLLGGCGVSSGGGEGGSPDASLAASTDNGVSQLGEHTTTPPTPRVIRPTAPSAPRTHTHPATHPPTTHATHTTSPALVREQVDNHNGAPVYADNNGTAVRGSLPGRIPYGTEVPVKCYEDNQAGLASVTAFYEIGGGQWAGNVVVADVMTNGGPLGNTNTPNIDPAVPAC